MRTGDPTLNASLTNLIEGRENRQVATLKFSAGLGIGGGLLLMFLGSAVARCADDGFLIGAPILCGGFAWELWGCVNYMRWKGYSGWFGFFGYLFLPGLLILACLPNRRERMLQQPGPERAGEIEELARSDRRPRYRFLLTLVPLGLLFVLQTGFLLWARSDVAAAEWQAVAYPGIGFQALMPGTPHLEEQIKETPAGKIEVRKFTVKPKGKKGDFMIVSFGFPEDAGRGLGGGEKLLKLGRQDVLAAAQGKLKSKLKSERPIVLNGTRGLELELLPREGAIIKARVYATKDHLYEVSFYASKLRMTSGDVTKFFDSFELSSELDAAKRSGETQ